MKSIALSTVFSNSSVVPSRILRIALILGIERDDPKMMLGCRALSTSAKLALLLGRLWGQDRPHGEGGL